MSRFDWKKNIEDSIKDGLIITIETTGLDFGIKAIGVKWPGTSLGATDIVKPTSLFWGGVLMKDYAVYKTRINE